MRAETCGEIHMRTRTSRLKALASLYGAGFDEMDIDMAEDGWSVYAMSGDKTALLTAELPASAFEGYAPEGRLGIRARDLADALKHMGEETDVRLSDGGARLTLSSGGFSLKVPLPPAPDGERRTPRLDYHAGFVCDLDPIRKVVDASKSVVTRVSLGDGGLTVESLDDLGCGPRCDLPREAMASSEGRARAGYGTEALQAFASRFPKGALASVELGDDMPMTLSFALDGLEGAFMLAPMIEEA